MDGDLTYGTPIHSLVNNPYVVSRDSDFVICILIVGPRNGTLYHFIFDNFRWNIPKLLLRIMTY